MKQANLLIVAALVAVVAVGAYFFSGKNNSTTPAAAAGKNSILTYVPDDTVLFFGSIEPFPYADSIKPFQKIIQAQQSIWENLKNTQTEKSPALKFGVHLLADFISAIGDSEQHLKSYGIDNDKATSAFYLVGGLPVLRIQLADAAAFNKKITALENESGIKGTIKKSTEQEYRLYAIEAGKGPGLAIGTYNNWAVFTIDFGEDQYNTFLPVAFGRTKPNKSLASSGRLQTLASKYGLHKGALGFVDHQGIVDGIFQETSNLAQARKMLEQNEPKLQKNLQELRQSGCEKDIQAIVANWPRTIFGYTKLDFTSQPKQIHSFALLEVKDSTLLDGLKQLRGYIPPYLSDLDQPQVVGIGLGLNIDKLMPVLSQWVGEIQNTEYSCPPLKDMQANIAKSNLMAVGMFSGIMAGVKGLSVSILDIELATPNPMPNIDKLDAIITLSAQDPNKLIMAASTMVPGMQGLKIPTDGSAVDFPMPIPVGNIAIKLAVKGSHIVAFTGEKAKLLSESLSKLELKNNGFIAMNVNYGKYMELAVKFAGNIMKLTGQSDMATWEAARDIKMQFVSRFDFNEEGIVFIQEGTIE